ncbi:MAG: protein-disulfide reductase DsbD N-terminal domain-containing protein [Pirellulales bacterium]|nr:protein-disulfide reductase DsbD N-terminal domain-containing protein [Pirellulales bacterium]
MCSHKQVAVIILAVSLLGCDGGSSLIENDAGGIGLRTASSLENLAYGQNSASHHESDGRVEVEVSSAWSEDGLLVIRGIFTPDDPGFHLYGSKLPKTGVDGIGRPTLLEVGNANQFQDVGALVSAEQAHDHHDEILEVTFPVYPDGAVTVYLPLRLNAAPEGPIQIPVKLTYMSCSDATCNSPVEGAVIEITAPAQPAKAASQP